MRDGAGLAHRDALSLCAPTHCTDTQLRPVVRNRSAKAAPPRGTTIAP
jgi:hypothetical protein